MENPFRHISRWWFYDQDGNIHGPFKTERRALKALLRHIDGPTRWQRVWQPVKTKFKEFLEAA